MLPARRTASPSRKSCVPKGVFPAPRDQDRTCRERRGQVRQVRADRIRADRILAGRGPLALGLLAPVLAGADMTGRRPAGPDRRRALATSPG